MKTIYIICIVSVNSVIFPEQKYAHNISKHVTAKKKKKKKVHKKRSPKHKRQHNVSRTGFLTAQLQHSLIFTYNDVVILVKQVLL